MSKANFSKVQFLEFLNYLKSENIHAGHTLTEWRSAAARLMDNLTASEEQDLRRINVDALAHRAAYAESVQNDANTASSLHHHRVQLARAVGDFIAYAINPMRYRAERARVAARYPEAGRAAGHRSRRLNHHMAAG